MKHKAEFEALVQHSHFLRSSMNLAYDRQQQLENTMHALGLSSIPTEGESFTLLQVQTAKEIGGVNTRMLLDAPEEIQKYHFGPLQIALSLLFAIIEEYKRLSRTYPTFQNDTLDTYCRENHQFVETLKVLRDSILHQRYDNMDAQRRFVEEFSGDKSKHLVTLLIEGERIYKDYLRRLWHLLQEDGPNEH